MKQIIHKNGHLTITCGETVTLITNKQQLLFLNLLVENVSITTRQAREKGVFSPNMAAYYLRNKSVNILTIMRQSETGRMATYFLGKTPLKPRSEQSIYITNDDLDENGRLKR